MSYNLTDRAVTGEMALARENEQNKLQKSIKIMSMEGGRVGRVSGMMKPYHNSINSQYIVRMNNQNNLYPDVTSQPQVNNQQGYAPPQNQGYVPPPQNYNQGYVPNNNYRPPPPPPQPYNNNPYNQGGQGFIPNQGGQGFIPGRGLMCPICRRETDNFPRKVPGGVTWIWCFGLFIFTGICCCIPFCVDSCQDTQLVCVVCQCVKARQEANCC